MSADEHSESAPAVTAAPAAPEAPVRRCENCGSPLYGEHCFACGQPTKGLVRHFSSILGDFFDTVFNIDSRVLRTIGPLLVRPGYLSLEYFAGRRVRYVTPMRLFLFLSLVAFFAVQGSIDYGDDAAGAGKSGIHVGSPRDDSFDKANTVAEVDKVRDEALAELRQARKEVENVPAGAVGIDIAIDKIKDAAERRKERIAVVDKARAAGKEPPPESVVEGDRDNMNFSFNDKRWDPVTNPLVLGWLPDAANKSLNRRIGHARDVLRQSNSEKPVLDAMFNVLPQTLLVMMPLFALMLKVAYLFKRRLYMEHMIVALHSHSFIALAVILIMGESFLIGLAPDDGFIVGVAELARGLTIAWIPLYLLIMQKRVYGQGWPMTLAKYGVLGLCYTILLGLAMAASILVGLLTL
jgi:hypothetical protein